MHHMTHMMDPIVATLFGLALALYFYINRYNSIWAGHLRSLEYEALLEMTRKSKLVMRWGHLAMGLMVAHAMGWLGEFAPVAGVVILLFQAAITWREYEQGRHIFGLNWTLSNILSRP